MARKVELECLYDVQKTRLDAANTFFSTAKPALIFQAKAEFNEVSALEANLQTWIKDAAAHNSTQKDPADKIDVTKKAAEFMDLIKTCKGKYYKLSEEHAQAIALTAAPAPAVPSNTNAEVKRLVIKPFHGNVEKWKEFYGMFTELIHKNPKFSDLEKFCHLKSYLRDDAATLLDSIDIEAGNYATALQTLEKTYESQRLHASHHIANLINYKYDRWSYQDFLKHHRNSVNCLKNLKLKDLPNFMFFELVYRNLRTKDQHEFNEQFKGDIPSYEELIEFIELRAKSEKFSHNAGARNNLSRSGVNNSTNNSNIASRALITTNLAMCFCCDQNHPITSCEKFSEMTPKNRFNLVKQKRICPKCLCSHGKNMPCPSKCGCGECGMENHHTLLHRQKKKNVEQANETPNVSNITPSHQISVNSISDNFNRRANVVAQIQSPRRSSVEIEHSNLLATVQCYSQNEKGQVFQLRGLLDPCSQQNLFTEQGLLNMGLLLNPRRESVLGVGSQCLESLGSVKLRLHNRDPTVDTSHLNFYIDVTCKVVPVITDELPSCDLPESVYTPFKTLRLADPEFYKKAKIDILLNVAVYCKLQIPRPMSPTFVYGQPSRIYTKWGWIILGELPANVFLDDKAVLMTNQPLEFLLNRFLNVEEFRAKDDLDLPVNRTIEQFFKNTTTRTQEGRYVVHLPFKFNEITLPNNRERAVRNFLALEKRLALPSNQKLYDWYYSFMKEYLDLGHMTLASTEANYIHIQHLVVKEQRSSTKLRVVFDASASLNGHSLNKYLEPGPKLHNDLSHILMSFRLHKITLCADITKMYRQILIREQDRQFQHVFYRPNPDEPLREYELNTLTYGQTSSPYIALRVIRDLADQHEQEFPLAASVLKKHTYVDDLASGAPSVQEARQLKADIANILQEGLFELKKFASNHPDVLDDMDEKLKEPIIPFSDDVEGLKVLGLLYSPADDLFYYKIYPFDGKITQREVLSYIAGIYDYLGLLAPVIFSLKVFMQRLCKERVGWDGRPSEQFCLDWHAYVQDVARLPLISVPRYIPTENCNLYLVAFSDASEQGMCSVAYFVTQVKHTSVYNAYLLMARTKLTSLKDEGKITIHRLELCAAVMAVELVSHIRGADFGDKLARTYYFTDNEVVLHWLRMDPARLHVFVANRIAKIKQDMSAFHTTWNYVRTHENPADLGTRIIQPDKLVNNKFWLYGPKFLKKPPDEWELPRPVLKTELPDVKKFVFLTTQAKEVNKNPLYDIILRFSSYSKLINVIGYVLRFIDIRLFKKPKPELTSLSVTERKRAVEVLVRLSQKQFFSEDLDALKAKKSVSKRLLQLTPFLDNNNVLRAEGRLMRAPMPDNAKFPIILDGKCHLSQIICRFTHFDTCHSGLRTVQATVAREFYIFGSRPLIKKIIRACPPCLKLSQARPFQPLMGELPVARVSEEYAFENTFLDFAGPFACKDRHKYRPIITKAYLMIAVSLSIKAVHLEVVSELSTPAFLDAFGRFAARRNYPKELYSDNGTNFKGGNNELKEVIEFLEENKEEIFSYLATRNVNWHFSSPYAPNMNGLVEAAVKSAKNLLYRQLGDKSFALTYEEYNSLFCRIESILNSRPLILQTATGEEPDYLCPSDFLLLKTPVAPPTADPSKNQILKDKFAHVIQQYKHFWKRWSGEYLTTLIGRQKWTKVVPNPQIGDVVFMKEMNTHPLSWPIGRIIAVHPGADSYVRVVDVKSLGGIYRRPVNKLVFLKVDT